MIGKTMPNKIKVMTFNTYLLHVPLFSIGASTRNTRINAMIRDNIFLMLTLLFFKRFLAKILKRNYFQE